MGKNLEILVYSHRKNITKIIEKNSGKPGKTWKKTVASVYCQKFFKYCRAS